MSRREATLHGRELELSRKEFDLLALLVSEGGHVVTRKQCMDRIWRDRKKGDSRTLDTHVKRLRKKIELNPAEPVAPDHRPGGGLPLQTVGARPRASPAHALPHRSSCGARAGPYGLRLPPAGRPAGDAAVLGPTAALP